MSREDSAQARARRKRYVLGSSGRRRRREAGARDRGHRLPRAHNRATGGWPGRKDLAKGSRPVGLRCLGQRHREHSYGSFTIHGLPGATTARPISFGAATSFGNLAALLSATGTQGIMGIGQLPSGSGQFFSPLLSLRSPLWEGYTIALHGMGAPQLILGTPTRAPSSVSVALFGPRVRGRSVRRPGHAEEISKRHPRLPGPVRALLEHRRAEGLRAHRGRHRQHVRVRRRRPASEPPAHGHVRDAWPPGLDLDATAAEPSRARLSHQCPRR